MDINKKVKKEDMDSLDAELTKLIEFERKFNIYTEEERLAKYNRE